MSTALPHDTRVVIIGAGQAGLSVAFHLRRLGLVPARDVVVLDRGPRAGGAWQFRWESLRLDTAHKVDDLPGMSELGLSFSTADQSLPARDVVSDYYASYERHFGLGVVRPVEVTGVAKLSNGRYEVQTSLGPVRAEVVVNASGTWARPFLPTYPGADTFAGIQLSTPDYRAAADLASLDVVVVGGGTSAVGFLLELEGVAASTTWVTRRPVEFTMDEHSKVAAVERADAAARAGLPIPSVSSGTGLPASPRNIAARERGVLVDRPMFSSIEADGVRWSDGTFQHADAIIWATGFRAELAHLAPLHLRESGGGVAVERGRSLRDPSIFLAGFGPQASTIGANRAGRVVATQVLDALAATNAATA
ncbi:FAD-dependent oxidoreductase [Agreia pratensis]|uniref:Pyridine nucleotide-disulphide oxidoreductase n=1 Tax=Agreia pratensis TaxID=150121 RepID=A0A1X7INS5_9MICO|nr:FAD-dependent oxidoreductase [Agreia pratensis]SMG16352.1 Pyridine nucleotide-disulphide oxidoreductase [Agreia pratensis]